MAANIADRGRAFEAEAEKKSKGGFVSNLFGSSAQRNEEAAELYVKAANAYKQAKDHAAAARAFQCASNCADASGNKHEMASNLVQCAKQHEQAGALGQAAATLETAIEIFCDEGRFSIAAKHQREVGELYEQGNELEKARTAFTRAAELFEGENAGSNANACYLKVANMMAVPMGEYAGAVQLYEKVARGSLDNNLLKFGVKDYFFRAVLCYMANDDTVGALEALDKYCDWDPTFGSTREAKFLRTAIVASDENNADSFTDAIVDYDSISKLDAWKTSLLLKCKRKLTGDGGAGKDDGSASDDGGLA